MKDKFQSKAVPRGTRTIWRYLSALFILFTFAIGNVWAADVTIFSANFSDAVWTSHSKICEGSTAEETVEGILFRSNNSSKYYSVADGTLTFCDNNIGDNYYFLIHLEDVNGSVHVSFGTVSNSQRISYKWFEQTARPTSSSSATATAGSINVNKEIALDYTMSGTGSDLWLMVGRQGSGQKTVIKTITITTPAAVDIAPAITAPTTDQSATYTVGDVITPLSVTATGSPTPTYQWYSNASASTTGATLITGAESASYTPSSAAESDLYFYCVATNSEGSAQSPYFHVEVNAAVATAPSFTSPASEPAVAEYFVGDVISALEVVAAGYPAPTLQWYSNSSKSTEGATLITGAESASYTPSNAAVSDLYFYCVATNASGTAKSEYFHVTVAAVSYCAELVPATSGADIAVGDVIDLQAGSNGGTMTAINLGTGNLAYNVNGLGFNSKSGPTVKVVLDHNMQVGTKLWIKLMAAGDKTRGLTLKTKTGSNISAFTCWVEGVNGATSGDVETFTYTVVAGDGLEGTNEFQLARNNSVWLQSLKVSNCGAELHALTSAVDPVGEATVTLSKNLVETSGIATANFTIANPLAYDFDEWVISSGDATIADAHADEAVITMGSTDAVITLKLKAAEVKHTVTYYDGETELGTELVVEGENPTATGIAAPKKIGYTFAGWSITNGGDATALSGISVAADMPLYAVYNAVNCSALSGTIFSLILNNAPAANCTIKNASGFDQEADLIKYGTVSGGIALAKNSSSNNHLVITTDPKLRLLGGSGKVHIQFDCALQEGDKIRTTIENQNIAYTTSDSRSTTNYFEKGTAKELTITKDHVLENASEIYLWSASSSDGRLISLEVIRPEKFAVTFNMHGHGDAVATQNIVSGGKVTEPATTDITGWDFGGWYKTYVAEPESYSDAWDFENDVVSAAVELHAKWTAHVASNDVALGTLSVNGEAITIVPSQTVYAVELPMGTSDIPTVVATANDVNAKACTVTQATAVDGSASIYIKAEDNTTEATYTINFSVAASKDIELVWDKSKQRCDATTPAAVVKSDDVTVSAYINKMTFTGGGEGNSLNVGNAAGNMVTLTAKPGYAISAMSFFGKIEADDAKLEYSLNGGAWTDLASTNAGDACYADVFTAAEVHELRMRSAGNKGFWIRNMQLTMIEACTPIVVAWDEEPVEFEVGKAGYAIAATANNSGTITYASADNTVIDVNASTGALTIAGLGSVALSASTPEGDGTTYCANGGDPIVLSKVVNTYYLVTFDGQNGEAADEVKYFSGDAAIAQPTDPSFPGHTFQGWFDAASAGNPVAFPLTPSASRTIYAQWTADCAGAMITTQPEGTSYLTGRTPAALVCEATAGNGGELTYEWFTCDDEYKANPVAATATPSTAVAGTFYYFCKVTEAGCAVEAFSNVVTITVTDKDAICLVKAELAAGSSAASITSTSGYYKDDANIAINIKKDLKLGSTGNYVKVAIDGANFQDGDVVEITLASDKTASAWLQIFTDEGTTMVAEMTSGVSREYPNYLTISGVPANTKTLYLYRTEAAGGNMNPYPTSMAVYRACSPILNKVTVAAVDGTPDNTNHIAIEVPFSTADAALDAIAYDWISNDAAWTAAHEPAVANAWEWGVENTVTLTDKDNDQSVYYVTISKAAASSDATLSALTVNGQAIALADGVFNYSFELPYGTSVVPTVAATPNHVAAVATVDPCTLSGATITVVPESGAGDQQVYTLTFVISKWKEIVIWDGSTMSAVATSPDAATGFAWAVNGFGSISSYTTTYGEKSYSKYLPSGGSSTGRYMTLTVPEGYVAKFYVVMASHSDGSERGMFIGSNLVKNPDATSVLELSNNDRDEAVAGTSEIVGVGTWYINPNASIDFQEIRAYLRPGYGRTDMLGNGVLGTVCVDHNVAIEDVQGATMYELMGRDYSNFGKLAFDEITSGELQAGAPYVFQAHGDKLILFFGETSVANPVDKGNGMYGTFEKIVLTELEDIYYFAQKALWSCKGAVDLTIAANRAYVKLSEVGEVSSMAPAPGRRRILMGVNGENQAQGFENIENGDAPMKVMIDGTLYILRGEKVFDATGRLVK